ncbi:MAG TPA: pectinesterase family protein [Clostridiales bacterium]|nr:pectinesterase family protein [Clostridiales bacterium]
MMLIQVAPGQSLQTVIDALPADDQPVTIHLAPGVYEEKIALRRPHTRIEGESAETTRITWHDGAAEILPDGKKRGTFRTATLLINARDCALRNVTVENSAYPREQVGQALALYVDGDGFCCEDCTLKSCQDTLFTAPLPPREIQKDGFIGPTQFLPRIPQRQVYRHCRIEGDVDFIFGGAAAWFEDCDIVSIDGLRDHGDKKEPALGFCTAASTPEGQEFGYVFMKCRFQGEGVPDGAIYLGRPWREFAKTVLLHCELGAHIRPEGWHDWNKPCFPATGYYAEFASTGAGSQGQRAAYVHRLTAEEAEKYTFERFWASISPEG